MPLGQLLSDYLFTRVVGALRAPPRSLRLPGENTNFLQAQKFKKFKLHIDLKSAGS